MKWESRQKEVQEGDRDLSGKAGGADSLWPVVLGRGGVGGVRLAPPTYGDILQGLETLSIVTPGVWGGMLWYLETRDQGCYWTSHNAQNSYPPPPKSLSHVRLPETPGTVAHQDPVSVGFSRQGYWSGLPCPPPGGSS